MTERELLTTCERTRATLRGINEIERELRAERRTIERDLELRAAELALGIEGRNETERRNALKVRLTEDEAYTRLQARADEIEDQLLELEGQREDARLEWQGARYACEPALADAIQGRVTIAHRVAAALETSEFSEVPEPPEPHPSPESIPSQPSEPIPEPKPVPEPEPAQEPALSGALGLSPTRVRAARNALERR